MMNLAFRSHGAQDECCHMEVTWLHKAHRERQATQAIILSTILRSIVLRTWSTTSASNHYVDLVFDLAACIMQ